VKRYSDPEDVRIFLGTFIDLHRKSGPSKEKFWQREGMPEFFWDFVSRFSTKGWIELYLLSVDKIPAASLLTFVHGNELSLYNIAYNPRFSAFSPGIFLFAQVLERAVSMGIDRVDFLRGGEKYKYNFGAKECKIKDFILSIDD
jgi:CelD/BcsL family acetyltransferase involved in cellulose biosynthesis